MADYILYHQKAPGINCPDGIASAWVAKLRYRDAHVVGCVYGQTPYIPAQAGDRLIIVDFSFPEEQIRTWRMKNIEVILIDHHITALENLSNLIDEVLCVGNPALDRTKTVKTEAVQASTNGLHIEYDMNESGASLAWKTFFPEKEIPLFIQYVKDRDLWIKKMPQTEEVTAGMSKIGRSFHNMFRWAGQTREQFLAEVVPVGQAELAKDRRHIEAAVERTQFVTIAGFHVPAVYLQGSDEFRLYSDICQEMYKGKYRSYHFVATVKDKIYWSLRSDKDKPGNGFDVGTLAKRLGETKYCKGGGGHRNASGFELKKPGTVQQIQLDH